MKKTKSTCLAFLPILLSPIAANADIIPWSLPTLTMEDGSEVSGMFDWDSDTNTVLDWFFTLTDGSNPDFPAAVFDPTTSDDFNCVDCFGRGDALFFLHNAISFEGRPLHLRFGVGTLDALDIAGTLALTPFDPGTDSVLYACYNCSPTLLGPRIGSITVPEPGTLALFGIGLLGVGLARRRKAA